VFLSFAEQSIPSGLASLICAFLPFYLLIINRLMGTSESFSKLSFLGLLVGIFGMGVIFYDSIFDILNGKYTLGIILTLLANLTWAFGTIYARKSNFKTNPLFSSGLQMIMMGIFISLISFLNGDFEVVKFSQPSVLAFFYLVVFGSIVGFGSFTYANAKLPTSVTSIYAYVNPVVAVLLGTLFLDEKITYFTVSGMFLTLIGVFLVNKGNS
jgi:drug/metabolite transporter (DMT)-like permease